MVKQTLSASETVHPGIARSLLGDLLRKGKVKVEHRRNGELLAVVDKPNLVVTAGKHEAAGLLGGLAGYNPFTYIAVGTGTTAPAVGDTALETEIIDGGLARAQDASPEVSENVLTVSVTFNVTASYAVTEAGLFNDASGGDMFARVTFAALNVQNGDTLTFTWEITNG